LWGWPTQAHNAPRRCFGVTIEGAGEASYAYVNADGTPRKISYWLKVNLGMTGLPVAIAVLGYVNTPNHGSVRAGVWLGMALSFAVLTLSRGWTLIHDRRHRGASREWWVAHHASVRRIMARGASLGFVVLAGWLVMALATGAHFAAALLVGPVVGVLAVLALLGDSLLKRRAGQV
jgi:hypothetical protein